MSDEAQSEIVRTKAEVRRTGWPGWIWAIPLAALLLVGWLALRAVLAGGADITLTFDNVHGLKASDTSVSYRGMTVGKVRDVALAKDGKSVEVTVHIDDSAKRFLRAGTTFWLRGATPSLSDPASLSALLSGPTIVMAPGPGPRTTHFAGLARKPVITGSHGPAQIFEVRLNGVVGGLHPGDPVTLRGFTVGAVKNIGWRYDARTGAIETPISLALYPSLFHIKGRSASERDAALKAMIDNLIRKGLRARLERDPPLVGAVKVTLDFMRGAPTAAPITVDGVAEIPAAPGGGTRAIITRLNNVPIDKIAQRLLDITRRMDALVSSPKLDDTLTQLDGTLRQLHRTAHGAGPAIEQLVATMRATANRLDRAARATDKLMGATPNQYGMQDSLREITEAARAVRELANYLDRHPEALIQGRSSQ